MASLKVVVVLLAMLCMNQASSQDSSQYTQDDQKVAGLRDVRVRKTDEENLVVAQSQHDANPDLFGFIKGAVDTVGNAGGALLQGAGNVAGGVLQGAGNLANAVVGGVANVATGLVNGAATVLTGAACAVGKVGAAIVGQEHNCGGPQLKCTWSQGTLGNGRTMSIGVVKGDQCAIQCYQHSLTQQGAGINGATIGHQDTQCYCQYGMNQMWNNQMFTSCMFRRDGGSQGGYNQGDAKVAKEKKEQAAFDYATEEFDVEKKK